MTEPQEPQEPTEPQEPVETPTEPAEPAEAPGEGDHPPEGGEPPEGPEETPSPGQSQGTSEKDMEKVFKALDNEAIRHAKRVGDILEEQAQDLIPCELCAKLLPGFRWPVVDEDQRAAVMLAIGFEPEPELRSDKRANACPDCDGFGRVATGSKVQGQDALPCIDCGGSGWVGSRRAGQVQALNPPMPIEAGNGPQPEPVSDPEREAAKAAAEARGFMVIDTRAPAA